MLRFCPLLLSGAIGVCLLSGCGAEQAKSPPPLSAPPPPPPPTVAPVAARPKSPADAASKTTSGGKTAKTRGGARPLPDAPDSHRVEIGEDIPNFELVPSTDPRSGALVAIIEPELGLDSTTVTLELPPPEPRSDGTTQPRSAVVGRSPPGFTAVRDAGVSDDGLPLRLRCDKDGSEMALVPAGLFIQGEDGLDEDAAPSHPVELSSFYIDVYEVTLGQYQKYWDETRPLPGRAANVGGDGKLPAVGITWKDATGYLEWVGKELPTEAEWEKAARGPEKFLYPWGDGRVLWHQSREPHQIDPVGSFPADRSIYGVYDMAGNAREWCSDLYADDAYRQAAGSTGALVTDWPGPKHASKPAHRVVRGGADDWQVWHRGNSPMLAPTDDIGFRGVLHWPPKAAGGSGAGGDPSQPPPTVAPRRGKQ